MIRITGADAAEFLQSQLTIDVAGIRESTLHPAAWCSPDGRARSVLLAGRTDDGMVLVLPAALAREIAGKLGMFSIGRDVEIGLAGSAGPAANEEDGDVYGLAYDPDRSLRFADDDAPLPDDWLAADIDRGMPWLLPATTGEFLPQMLGLEPLGGLSYGKGCYPGQEVIARVHYRGRVKHRTARFDLQADAPPAPGSTLALSDGKGTVLFAAPARSDRSRGTVRGLAVVPADTPPADAVTLENRPGVLVAD